MSSRNDILKRVKQNKPSEDAPLPDIPYFERNDIVLAAHFVETLQFVGGRAVEIKSIDEAIADLKATYPDAKKICTNLPDITIANVDTVAIADAHVLADLDLALLQGAFGVAENAAIWIEDNMLTHRAIPFITQHMAILLYKNTLVWNMHQAYDKVHIGSNTGYGVFISGPSKTADIEQSLVIGAHGSRSLTVYLI